MPAHRGTTCSSAANKEASSPGPLGNDIWGSRGSAAPPLRPVRGFDGSRKFNPRTCWDAEEPSSGKAFPTSRTSAGSGIACQKSFKPDDKFILCSCTGEMGVNDTYANKF